MGQFDTILFSHAPAADLWPLVLSPAGGPGGPGRGGARSSP